MRTLSIRRALAVAGIAAVALAGVVGCSSDDSSDATDDTTATTVATATTEAEDTTEAETTEAAGGAADAETTQAVTDAWVTFFNGTTPPETRAGLVENGDAFLPALEGMVADPQATATTATVEGVTSAGDDAAVVSWTLLMNDAPVLPDQSGEALLEDGQWKVSAVTFCTLLAIQGDGSAVPGC
ncbi:hypothetical protein [Rhodococcus artemisiae]|uniref:Low molecular weight antigen MTB12-like C-terminal domain-containing protein n=1 Tax=Rhodococcus artemisiae TaxID=714159 RepID=A0ABU7LHT9_9NOCA|nr:hypothetical protein [Rhodococcus artemisiae]MEE2060817.1 hypothetical protein [Rhodococcus artemisiae]